MRKHHNKLFYGKYRHKVTFDMPWAGMLYPYTNETLEGLINGTHRDCLHLNKNFWKVDSRVKNLAKFIKDNRTKMKFRLQQYSAIFYCNKGMASKLVCNFWEYWKGSKVVDPKASKLDKNTVVCARLPHGKFKYQIHIRKDSHKLISISEKNTIWRFLQNNKDNCLISSRQVIGFLAGENTNCWGGYFYIKDQKMLTPIYMIANKIIEKVIHYKELKNESNKKITRT